ncbi:hypothetical protein AA101099_0053 [Neoasaia chiangmaiensis NBRC 101099]|uniref:Uncharacterized protein n=1 Tax=Neoasaia chiangmaiensis TaxID=320497 RepID=A0A1U9KLV2_9PROT|nr:DUF3035 domain-containing protein [Neoasaia chiangmaiensis]AQS86772.1 hypothetical protein A0U93_01045 [Neoasaia chiangmaiensis]GBR35507.1 hypothetical protein AA101099_0053 [Neoasaia chiangmaiensis NBRC 101099]GEN16372.1 hypothetical protein NCH01_28030 [Neoasaia chiangmaiensis]
MAQHPSSSARFVQRALPLLGGVMLLAGCSGNDISRAFSLERSTPDEYTVTTRAPLSMPPSEKLSAPGSGQQAPDESPSMQALETLSPNAALHQSQGSTSAGQSALVGEVDKASSAPNNAELGTAGAGLVDNLMFWHGGSAGSVVDGTAENRRIQQESALGKGPASGATPTVRAKSSGFLGIF